MYHLLRVGGDSVVGIATRYGLDGPGIESRLEARFSATVQTSPGTHPASDTKGTGSFAGIKWPRCGVGHTPLSSVGVKERVELYLYSTSSWLVIGRPLPLPPTFKINEFCMLTTKCRHVSITLKGSNRLTSVMKS